MSITIVIIGISVLVSALALSQGEWFYKLQFNAYQVVHRKEWHRFITHAFVHGSWMHLALNMYVLYLFGSTTETFFELYFGLKGYLYYVLLYVGGILFSSLPAVRRHKDNPNYNAVGASGAVAAVLFSSILFMPMQGIGFMFIPIRIPAFIFGALYIALEIYLDKRRQGNIAHDAHYWGAIFGVVFTIAVRPAIVLEFIQKVSEGMPNL